MTPERKKKALDKIDQAMKGVAGMHSSVFQELRDLIDPPISALTRAEIESELKALRAKVIELQTAAADDLPDLVDENMEWRRLVGGWSARLKYGTRGDLQTWISDTAHHMDAELNKPKESKE